MFRRYPVVLEPSFIFGRFVLPGECYIYQSFGANSELSLVLSYLNRSEQNRSEQTRRLNRDYVEVGEFKVDPSEMDQTVTLALK